MAGLFASEQEMMDLYDAGADYDTIAAKTGKSRGYVQSVVERYRISDQALNAFDRMSAEGTRYLLAAIRRDRPEVIAGGNAHA